MTAADFLPWLQLIVLPLIYGLFEWLRRTRQACADEDRVLHSRVGALVKSLSDFRVKAAETYVSQPVIDARLQRMEDKIDQIIRNGTGRRPGAAS